MYVGKYVTSESLLRVFPDALPIVLKTIDDNPYEFYKRRVNTPMRLAHFFGQCGYETDGLTKLTEVGNKSEYRGRGLIQLTSKNNYTWIGNLLGVSLVTNPDKVLQSPYFLTTALEFWYQMGLNALADADNGTKITRLINGGYNGLDERLALVRHLKQVLFS